MPESAERPVSHRARLHPPGRHVASARPPRSPIVLSPRRVARWIYLGRLSLSSAIFVAAVFAWRNADELATLAAALALFGSIAITAGSVWFSFSHPRRVGQGFFYVQALFDLVLVTVVVHITGGAASQFAALYILVTAGASLVLPVGGGLLVAALGNALYFTDVLWARGDPADLGVALQLLVFAIVALGTAYLSARLKEAGANRESLEAQLALARLQAEDILRNIRSGIITVDARGRLLYANPAAATMLDLGPSSSGRLVGEVLRDTAPALGRALEHAVRERERIVRGEAIITARGRAFPIGLTTTTIDADGAPGSLSATAIFQDISDNKRLEALRLRTERLEAVTELSASLAHEIKNPLASIRSAVEQLARVPAATDDERTLGCLIVRESDRLSRLLSEFLDFARARVTRMEAVNVAEIARAATASAAAHPDRRPAVEVTCADVGGELLVEGDEDLLHRAVFNLVLNAVQAAPEGGHVSVEVSLVSPQQAPPGVHFGRDAVAVRVTDDGPGIPEAIRDRIFDPFFTTRTGGTGLGLPIVHRAIEAHRGVVLVDHSGSGTRLTILLPRCLAAAAAEAA